MPVDEAWIMRRVRAHTDDEKDIVRTVLAEFFTAANGRYSNARLTQEWLSANDAHAKRKAAGAKGGKAKALKDKEKTPSNAEAMPKQPEPEPELDIKTEPIGSAKKRRKPEIEIPEDWVPNDRNISDATDRGFSRAEIDHEADRFRNHHLSKQSRFRDWDAAWRTWLGNARKFESNNGMAGKARPARYGSGSSIASIVARRRAAGEI
jgi:uncharacterized protein YdaU (DUF1376 family)